MELTAISQVTDSDDIQRVSVFHAREDSKDKGSLSTLEKSAVRLASEEEVDVEVPSPELRRRKLEENKEKRSQKEGDHHLFNKARRERRGTLDPQKYSKMTTKQKKDMQNMVYSISLDSRWMNTVILPTSRFRIIWDLFVALFVLYISWAVPYVVCFPVYESKGWKIFNALLDIFFWSVCTLHIVPHPYQSIPSML